VEGGHGQRSPVSIIVQPFHLDTQSLHSPLAIRWTEVFLLLLNLLWLNICDSSIWSSQGFTSFPHQCRTKQLCDILTALTVASCGDNLRPRRTAAKPYLYARRRTFRDSTSSSSCTFILIQALLARLSSDHGRKLLRQLRERER